MRRFVGLFILAFVFLVGCNGTKNTTDNTVPNEGNGTVSSGVQTNTPAPTETPVPTATSTPTPTPTLTPTPAPTATPTPTPTPDVEAPVLTLLGESTVEVIARSEYVEPGFTAIDNVDGDITELVQVTGEIDVNWCDTYTLTYEVTDQAGNQGKIERTVIVKQPDVIVPEGKVIYLTFDDGPGRYTDQVLEILDKYDIKATFFTCINGWPAKVTEIHEKGHTVAIHCKSHNYNVIYASEEAYFDDLFTMQDLVYECTGVRQTLVRFPGGSSNASSKFNPGIMTRLTEKLKKMGFQYIDWNASSEDSFLTDKQAMFDEMIPSILKTNCAVVLLHSETNEHSVNMLEEFILWGFENGYRYLPMDTTSPRAQHRVWN